MVPNCSSNSFSLFFPLCSSEGGGGSSMTTEEDNYSLYYFSSSSSSSSVDCTLSLGTPSTRNASTAAASTARVQPYSSPDGFGWDHSTRSTQSKTKQQPSFAAAAANAGSLGGDPLLLARRCANCDTTSTPLWRNGPKGPKSLCNACGIRYKKEERRASASTTRNGSESSNGYNSTNVYQQQQQCPWSCYQSTKDTSNSSSSSSSSWYQNNEDRYLSWRLNVVPPPQFDFDRPTLFH